MASFFCLQIVGTYAQGTFYTVRDFETWSSLGLNYKHNKKLRFGLEQQLRLNNNSSQWSDNFTELTARLKTSKSFRLGFDYRYLRRNDTEGNIQGTKTYHRYAFHGLFKKDIKRTEVNARLQYQYRNQFGENMSINTEPVQKLRVRIGGAYNIKKWKYDPQVSFELFQPLFSESPLEKWRFTIETERDFKKFGALSIFYRIEKELNVTLPLTSHIAGINYTFTLNRKKND